jgi:hypothetical protein
MSNTNNGGPAFPLVPVEYRGELVYGELGLTVRDYFAAKVMQGLWSLPSSFENDAMSFEMCADTAYKQADAMLAAREAA